MDFDSECVQHTEYVHSICVLTYLTKATVQPPGNMGAVT